MKIRNASIVLAAIATAVVGYSCLDQSFTSHFAERTIAFVNPNPVSPMGPFFAAGYPIQAAPGTYNFNALDQTKVSSYVLQQFEDVRKEDRAIIEKAIAGLNDKYASMVNLVYAPGGLAEKSINSISNSASSAGKLSVADVMKLQMDFDRAYTLFANEVGTIDALPQMLADVRYEPSLKSSGVDKLARNLQGVNFAQFKNYYQGEVANLKAKADQLAFTVMLPSGNFFTQHGLTDLTELKKQKLFSPDDYRELQAKMIKFRAAMTSVNTAIGQSMHPKMVQMVRNVVSEFGTRQSYRENENTDGQRRAIKNLEELFYVRSGLRALYGIPLGAMRIQYDLRAFNLDKLMSSVVIDAGIARSLEELTTDQNNVFNALEAMKFKGVSPRDLFKPGHSFLSKVSSVLMMLKGQSNTVGIKAIILPFIAQDIEEERMLATSSGWNGVLEGYKKRYNTAAGGEWEAARKMYFPRNGEVTGSFQQSQVNTESLIGIKNVTEVVIRGKLADIAAARDIEKQLEALEMGDAIFKETQDRANDL